MPFEDITPLSSTVLGADPEADEILSELRSTGPEGRPATQPAPTRADFGLSGREEPHPLTRLGLLFSNISAGIRGQPLPSLEFEKQQREEEDRDLDRRLRSIGFLFGAVEKLDALGLSDEQRQAAAPEIAKLFRGVGGVGYSEKFFTDLLTSPGQLGLWKTLLPRLSETASPRALSRLMKDESLARHILGMEKSLQRQTAIARLKQLKASGMTFETQADIEALVPEAQHLSPEDFAGLGIKTGKAALAGQEAGARKAGELETEAGALETIRKIEEARAKGRRAEAKPTMVDLLLAAGKGDKEAIAALAAQDKGSIGAFVTTLVRRRLGNDVDDPDIQKLTPQEANALLGELGRVDAIRGLLNQALGGALTGLGGTAAPGPPAARSPSGAPVLGLGAPSQGTGKAPKQSDIDAALKRAKGDKQQAAEALRKRGFDLNAPIVQE